MKMLLKAGRPSTAVADSRDREDSWVLHASVEFSKANMKTSPEDVAEILAEHFVMLLDLDYEMDILESHAYLWQEGRYPDFGPYVSDELLEAQTSVDNFMQACVQSFSLFCLSPSPLVLNSIFVIQLYVNVVCRRT
jgi:hypothetical protein